MKEINEFGEAISKYGIKNIKQFPSTQHYGIPKASLGNVDELRLKPPVSTPIREIGDDLTGKVGIGKSTVEETAESLDPFKLPLNMKIT